MEIELELAGDVQLRRKILRISNRTVDATPAFRHLLDDLERHEAQQFSSQGAMASGGWAPLAASTIASKRRRGLDPRILHATGALRASLTGSGGDGIRDAGPDEMRFGTRVPYAALHQHGTSRMPRRRPLELRERDRREAVRVLQRYVITGQA